MRKTQDTTVLVTGATDGIGLATARMLVAHGAHVVVHGRSVAKAEAAAAQVREGADGARVDAVAFDLSSLADVRRGAAEVLARFPRLHVLVNNAGVMTTERRVTVDGFELMFAVNHLAPFLLTELLRPALRGGAPARVVNVSSVAHNRGAIRLDDLQQERGWSAYGAYAASKLANVLHANALSRRLDPREITANALHPGVIGTKLLRAGFNMTGGTPEQGAQTSAWLAISPDVQGITGKYFDDCTEVRAQPAAHDTALQDALSDASARLVGL